MCRRQPQQGRQAVALGLRLLAPRRTTVPAAAPPRRNAGSHLLAAAACWASRQACFCGWCVAVLVRAYVYLRERQELVICGTGVEWGRRVDHGEGSGALPRTIPKLLIEIVPYQPRLNARLGCTVYPEIGEVARAAVRRLRGMRLCADGGEATATHLVVGKDRRTLKVRIVCECVYQLLPSKKHALCHMRSRRALAGP